MHKTAKAPPTPKEAYQIKIQIDGIEPPVWRRVMVKAAAKLGELHDVIQASMGWEDCHLHLFDVGGIEYTRPAGEPLSSGQRNETKVRLNQIFSGVGASITYIYDLGDGWLHTITLEKIIPVNSVVTYPLAVAGERSCPPEDSGGIGGFDTILRALRGEDVEDRELLLEWLPSGYDPNAFDLEAANRRIAYWPDLGMEVDEEYPPAQDPAPAGPNSREALYAEIQQEVNRREPASIEELQRIVTELTNRRNQAQQSDFCGLSSYQMHRILDFPFESPDVIEFPTKLSVNPSTSRLGILFVLLVTALGTDGLKATVTGNLPRNLVREIAAQAMSEGELDELSSFRSLQSETDYVELNVTRIIAQHSGMVRKVKGKFVTTKTCQKLMASGDLAQIFPKLFTTLAGKFNWAYVTRFRDLPFVQRAFAFSLYLLDQYGDEWRSPSFYEDLFLQAFPQIVQSFPQTSYSTPEEGVRSYYNHICLSHFCVFSGVAEAQMDGSLINRLTAIRKTPLLNDVVRFHVQSEDSNR